MANTISSTPDIAAEQQPPITVKEVLQSRVTDARNKLEEALMVQVKAEVLGINDWPFADLGKIVYHPF